MKTDRIVEIEKTEINNNDNKFRSGNPLFNTFDYVFVDEVGDVPQNQCFSSPTDYAIANGCKTFVTPNGDVFAEYWLRESFRNGKVATGGSRAINKRDPVDLHIGVRPCINLDVDNFIRFHNPQDYIVYESNKDKAFPPYHIIEIKELQYPQTKVDDATSKILTNLLIQGQLKPTGKKYKGFGFPNCDSEEFECNGEYYVKKDPYLYSNSRFKDGTKARPIDFVWIKVEPIKWIIRNWNDLPSSINPNGFGVSSSLQLRSEDILTSACFVRENKRNSDIMWQNSELRAYLNGYDLLDEVKNKGNGNEKYKPRINYDFSFVNGGNFMNEMNHRFMPLKKLTRPVEAKKETEEQPEENLSAPSLTYKNPTNDELLNNYIKSNTSIFLHGSSPSLKNPYNFTYKNPTNDELLNNYIKSNTSIFLHGPSGVGKSARVLQIDPTATRITLRPQMNPEEIDGILNRETNEYRPPLWYTDLCEKCEREPNRNHILFIDELTNVKPTIQSLVYSIVLDRAGKDGLWPLPKNAVVVAAGNESNGNLAAYPLTNALFRRFCHIYYDIDKNNFLNWATSISKNNPQEITTTPTDEKQAKIHPAIVAYLMGRDEKVLYQELDEENPSIVTDPRKWEIASKVLYETKNPYNLLPAIGENLTADFVDFVQNIQLTVEDVLNENYNKNDYKELPIDKKMSTIVGLCTANEDELPKVRSFIEKNLGKEILASFDTLWIGNDPERAMIIAEQTPSISLGAN